MTAAVIETRFEPDGAVTVQPGAVVGLVYAPDCGPARIAGPSVIRTGAIIYGDVTIGAHFQSGHHAMIRERTTIGRHVVVGTNTVIEGQCSIGDFVKIESNCFIPTMTEIGSRVFLGPNVVFANDKYPLRQRDSYVPQGPKIEDNVTLGAGCVVLPGVRIGAGSFVAAGAVVTRDVPPRSLVQGVPGRVSPLPAKLDEPNLALSWRKHLDG